MPSSILSLSTSENFGSWNFMSLIDSISSYLDRFFKKVQFSKQLGRVLKHVLFIGLYVLVNRDGLGWTPNEPSEHPIVLHMFFYILAIGTLIASILRPFIVEFLIILSLFFVNIQPIALITLPIPSNAALSVELGLSLLGLAAIAVNPGPGTLLLGLILQPKWTLFKFFWFCVILFTFCLRILKKRFINSPLSQKK